MTFGEKAWDALMDQSRLLGRKCNEAEAVAVLDRLYAAAQKERRKAAVAEGAELIYAAYPKKVGRDEALTAITKQLKNHPLEYLLDKTSQFARAVESWPSSYRYFQDGGDRCPHPSTWFNQGRFQDDPKEWRRAGSRSGPANRPAPAGPTEEQERAAEQEAAAMRDEYLAMPEPEKGTLAHSMWLEARRNNAVTQVAASVTSLVKQVETEQLLRKV